MPANLGPNRHWAIAVFLVALLIGFCASAVALGTFKYGLTGGVTYASGSWQSGGTTDLYNGHSNMNIGNAYIELYRNGVGFVSSNSPGVFLGPYGLTILCVAGNCNPGYSVIGKCRSSNTRSQASCAIG